ncbi:hypothetical protein LSAT2_015256 [Lamellibrachia satsuma]|nr:hypothetical protein LSAT2_015256 [Lamellibrachia satsuma]
MAEMQQMTIERRATRATGQFRDDLYTDGLLPSFMHHASLWRHVLSELQHLTFGYRRHDIPPDSWDDACHSAAALLDHKRRWLGVMAELQRYPKTPSCRSPLLRRRRRTLAPLPLDNLGRKMTSRRLGVQLVLARHSDWSLRRGQGPVLRWGGGGVGRGGHALLGCDHTLHDAFCSFLVSSLEGDPESTPNRGTPQHPLIVFNCPFANYPAHARLQCVSVADAKSPKLTEHHEGLTDDDVIEHFLNFDFATGAAINTRRFLSPTVPFYQDYASHIRPCSKEDCSAGCHCTHMLQLPYNRTVQLVLLNYSPTELLTNHPIHTHGHGFSVVRVSYSELNVTTGEVKNNSDIVCDDEYCAQAHWRDGVQPALNLRDPPIKDVVNVPAKGYVVIRFRTLNPGFWFMHCHIETHAQEGMAMIFNEAPERHPPLPVGFPTCGNYDIGADGYEETVDKDKTPNKSGKEFPYKFVFGGLAIALILAAGLAALLLLLCRRSRNSRKIDAHKVEVPTKDVDTEQQ